MRNVLGGELEVCGTDPVTGFTRSGGCEVTREDVGGPAGLTTSEPTAPPGPPTRSG